MKKLIIIFIAALLLVACSRLTKENYDLLKLGMSQDEVQAIIGAPSNCSETLGTTSCIWGSEDGKHIKIIFLGDNATTFSNNGLK
ncbi:DUF3862 domain-containing protein [Planctobacterium marinum]|uniref:DUF3862 domain-containing protein n=1 Tax=Planctobacterium marinum TaxID=1631968 RepID=UPI001E63E7C6|nr:DUF3862 domain-containing protein [Planctobacterium marinum]MCC2604378.1 DUF3862 domain-containing protein [Planctobacterium marinum]